MKRHKSKWWISQAARFDDTPAWFGPYDTLQAATQAIARKLAEEANERYEKYRKNYGVDE